MNKHELYETIIDEARVGLLAGRVWDLRTGRSILTLAGHVKGVLAADWSPNGHVIGTGSIDHSARIWDIRGRRSPCVFTIPAHKSLVSQVLNLVPGL